MSNKLVLCQQIRNLMDTVLESPSLDLVIHKKTLNYESNQSCYKNS